MALANTLMRYMRQHRAQFDVVTHPHSYHSTETAELAHIPGDRLAKAVVLEDDQGYLLAVLPANRHVELGRLHRGLARRLGLATEREIATLFEDCETGAVPALGAAYGIETILDDSLAEQPDVYFEGGDHEQLVHMSGAQFRSLLAAAAHGRFSRCP